MPEHFSGKEAMDLHGKLRRLGHTNRLILAAFFSGLAAIFQSAGSLFPGIGYLISPLATAPVVICTILSVRLGFLSYLLAIVMLLFSHPSELLIFPFTTGLLGLAIGTCFFFAKSRLAAVMIACFALASGIFVVLYGLQFPLLGPAASAAPDIRIMFGIVLFSALYSWIWVWGSHFFIKKLNRIAGQYFFG